MHSVSREDHKEVPSNVARFERLMYLSLGIGLIEALLTWNRNVALARAMGGAYFVLFGQIFVLAFFVLFIWLVARRRKNWARWLLLILQILGLPGYVRALSRMLPSEPLAGALSLAQFLVIAMALVLVFTGNARDWFRIIPAAV